MVILNSTLDPTMPRYIPVVTVSVVLTGDSKPSAVTVVIYGMAACKYFAQLLPYIFRAWLCQPGTYQ